MECLWNVSGRSIEYIWNGLGMELEVTLVVKWVGNFMAPTSLWKHFGVKSDPSKLKLNKILTAIVSILYRL